MQKKYLFIPILSLVGFISSFWQTAEKIHTLKNPDAPLSCDINPIVDCGSVLGHNLAAVFGVPNSMLGMAMFGFLFAIGLAFVYNKSLSKVTANMAIVLATAAMGFSIWFFGVSLYEIGKICIFCVAIWSATIPLFVLTLRAFDKDIFGASQRFKKLRTSLQARPLQFIVPIYVLAIFLFLYRFRDYYFG